MIFGKFYLLYSQKHKEKNCGKVFERLKLFQTKMYRMVLFTYLLELRSQASGKVSCLRNHLLRRYTL